MELFDYKIYLNADLEAGRSDEVDGLRTVWHESRSVTKSFQAPLPSFS